MNIELGSICIGIRCQDQAFLEKMRLNYLPFLVSREPDFRIELSLNHNLTASEVSQRLLDSRKHNEGNRCFTEPALLDMLVDWKQGFLRVETESEIFSPSVDYKLMNQLMIGIYGGVFAKLKNTVPDAYLAHGCGIENGTRGYLFTGPSGAGKTTIAKLAGGRRILNDESVLIGGSKDGLFLSGTPLDGGQPEKQNSSTCLSSVFFLKHAPQVSIRKLNNVEAYLRIVAQFFPTSPLFEESDNECLRKRAAISARMVNEVPMYELAFRLDSSFWQAIEAI